MSKFLTYLLKILTYPLSLIYKFFRIIFSEMGSITFRDIVKFVLISFATRIGAAIIRLIIAAFLVFTGMR